MSEKKNPKWIEAVIEANSRPKRDQRVVMMLTLPERRAIEAWCERTGLTLSDFVRGCVAAQGMFSDAQCKCGLPLTKEPCRECGWRDQSEENAEYDAQFVTRR